MKKDLIYTYTNGMSHKDWLQFRKNGFGASEIGGVLGLSPYTSPLEIFYDKISDSIGEKYENLAMFLGTETEAFIAKLHQYWDGDEESMITNYRNNNVVRKNRRVNAYIQNPKWEHLLVSLDRKITSYKKNGELFPEEVLEIKNMSGFVKNQWEYGIPPMYMAQLQQQLLVTNIQFGELALMIDGRNFEVHRFERNDEFCEHIINRSTDLWNKITEARKLQEQKIDAELNFNQKLVNEINQEIISLEPEVDNSISLSHFLSDKYKNGTEGEKVGSFEELEWAIKHKELKNEVKEKQKEITLFENKLKHSMKDIEVLNFQDDGKVHWSNSKNGRRIFRNRIK